jgi:hypothetical protein
MLKQINCGFIAHPALHLLRRKKRRGSSPQKSFMAAPKTSITTHASRASRSPITQPNPTATNTPNNLVTVAALHALAHQAAEYANRLTSAA